MMQKAIASAVFFLCVAGLDIAPVLAESVTRDGVDFTSFSLIVERNIFSPERQPLIQEKIAGETSMPAPESEPMEYINLLGTIVSAHEAVAFFEGSSTQYQKVLAVGDAIGEWRVSGLDTESVYLKKKGQPVLILPVGARLERRGARAWKISEDATEAQSAISSDHSLQKPPNENAGAASAATDDTLKKMLLRRQQEITP